MIAKTLFILGAVGIGLIALGMGVELVFEYWYVAVVVLAITTLIWIQRKKQQAARAWKSRYQENRKARQ
jgi:Flp pilus assembly protein TadB